IVSAGVVFDTLTGQTERGAWLPGLAARMELWRKELRDEEYAVRAKAIQSFAQLGDLARPFLEALPPSADLEESTAARNLLQRLEPREMLQPLGPVEKPKR